MSYISDMSAYQVRNLTGAYAPSNGFATMQSVTPSEWITSDPGTDNLPAVVNGWSGGGKSISGTDMYVHGGGHNDSANNGLYKYSFAGTTQPTGWSLLSISAVSAVPVPGTGTPSYTDGRWASCHTYDSMQHAHHNNFFYRFGGSIWNAGGGFTRSSWKYNLATNAMTQLTNIPAGMTVAGTPVNIYDPSSGKFMVATSGYFDYACYRTSTDTWSSVKTAAQSWGNVGASAAYDSTRSRALVLLRSTSGSPITTARTATVNWTTETVTMAAVTPTGSTSIAFLEGPSLVYDPTADRFWVFGGEQGSTGYTTIYEVDPVTFAFTPHTLTGDTITIGGGGGAYHGSWGRFVFMDAERAIGMVASTAQPASVIRLPGTSTEPPAPTLPDTKITRRRFAFQRSY